jgi:hypothetical protein
MWGQSSGLQLDPPCLLLLPWQPVSPQLRWPASACHKAACDADGKGQTEEQMGRESRRNHATKAGVCVCGEKGAQSCKPRLVSCMKLGLLERCSQTGQRACCHVARLHCGRLELRGCKGPCRHLRLNHHRFITDSEAQGRDALLNPYLLGDSSEVVARLCARGCARTERNCSCSCSNWPSASAALQSLVFGTDDAQRRTSLRCCRRCTPGCLARGVPHTLQQRGVPAGGRPLPAKRASRVAGVFVQRAPLWQGTTHWRTGCCAHGTGHGPGGSTDAGTPLSTSEGH